MASSDYISREAAIDAVFGQFCASSDETEAALNSAIEDIKAIPAADVLPRDEAIKMGAELAAMHGSDATSQQFEEAYLKGVEYGMTRRDVRPVVRGKWIKCRKNYSKCSECGTAYSHPVDWTPDKYCSECGARLYMED